MEALSIVTSHGGIKWLLIHPCATVIWVGYNLFCLDITLLLYLRPGDEVRNPPIKMIAISAIRPTHPAQEVRPWTLMY